MLSVVRVSQSMSTTPAMTAGIVNPTAGHVAEVDLSARPASDGEVLHLLQGIHLLLGDLDLHLIADAAHEVQ
jgi:hypothetical protein